MVTHYQHYLNRHRALENQSIHRLIREREFRRFHGRGHSNANGSALRPLQAHLQQATHVHVKREKVTVVARIGYPLPSITRMQELTDEDVAPLRRQYAQHVLALFLQHRSAQQLAGVSDDKDLTSLGSEYEVITSS